MEGLEIGSVSVKWVQLKNNGEFEYRVERHEGNPQNKINEIFGEQKNRQYQDLVVTGQSAKLLFDAPYRPETECIERSLRHFDEKPDLLLSLGGENFLLYTLKYGFIKNILTTSKCAAGTGEFIVQQLQRMGMTLEKGIASAQDGKIVPLATRCSVYCKSDATHKLNKGECAPSDIAHSLIWDLVDKVTKLIELAQTSSDKIMLTGGISLNQPFVQALQSKLNGSELLIPEQSHYIEAFGAALLSSDESTKQNTKQTSRMTSENKDQFDRLAPLNQVEHLLDYRAILDREQEIENGANYILGIDAGSTTTKAVLYHIDKGTIDASIYLRTFGNPVAATKRCIHQLIEQIGDKSINIIQTGVTGSGRELCAVFLDNCLSYNEILAHARAASEEVPEVNTVFEIGGQDSKFISFLHQVPVDYAMNEGCSAGTGSFLEESVSVDMNIPLEAISQTALTSKSPIAFGERCAAFINTDLRNALQQGSLQEDVVAGLVYSIARNYISRIVGVRSIGEFLLFQGGVALNKSVALAMAALTEQKLVVPRYPELMGCLGVCLLAMDHLNDQRIEQKSYDIHSLVQGEIKEKSKFKCASCDNKCDIRKIEIRERVYPFGGLCSKFEIVRRKNKTTTEGKDFIQFRNEMMFNKFLPEPHFVPDGVIGLPLALSTYEFFPFYSQLIHEWGYNCVLSYPSKTGNTKTRSSLCYPCEIAHGAVYDLTQNQKTGNIFLPFLIEGEIPEGYRNSYICSSTAIMPNLINRSFKDVMERIISPQIAFSNGMLDTTKEQLQWEGVRLGLTEKDARSAVEKAWDHQQRFKEVYADESMKELEKIRTEPKVIIAGRPYLACSKEANIALPRKITSKGYHALYIDMIPDLGFPKDENNSWYFTQQIQNALQYAKKTPNTYVVLLSCFSCIPDASMIHLYRELLAGETFCYLEIDSHTAHAGFETRVGAFLDIIEENSILKHLRN